MTGRQAACLIALVASGLIVGRDAARASTRAALPCGISFEFSDFAANNPYPRCGSNVAGGAPQAGANAVSIRAGATARPGVRVDFTMVGFADRKAHLVYAAQTFGCESDPAREIAALGKRDGRDGAPVGVYVWQTFGMVGHFSVLASPRTPVVHLCAYLVLGSGTTGPLVGHASAAVTILPTS